MSRPEPLAGMHGKLVKDSICQMVESLALFCQGAPVAELSVPEATLRKLMIVAVRLYAAAAEQAGRELPLVDCSVNTTEAVITAVALLRSQNLTAFEAALWFARLPPRE
jgi:hypothetical protein